MWDKSVPSFWDFIASRCGHCNIEPFGTGVGGAGQSLDPHLWMQSGRPPQPDPFSVARMVLAHVCCCQLTSSSLQKSPDHGHHRGLSGPSARAGPSRALLAPQGLCLEAGFLLGMCGRKLHLEMLLHYGT